MSRQERPCSVPGSARSLQELPVQVLTGAAEPDVWGALRDLADLELVGAGAGCRGYDLRDNLLEGHLPRDSCPVTDAVSAHEWRRLREAEQAKVSSGPWRPVLERH